MYKVTLAPNRKVSSKAAKEFNSITKNKLTLKNIASIIGVGINKVEAEFRDMFKEYLDDLRCSFTRGIKHLPRNIALLYFSHSQYVNDGRYLFFGVKEYREYQKKPKKTVSVYITDQANDALSRKEMQYVLEWWASLSSHKKIKLMGGNARPRGIRYE